jgi:hypothetical protein
MRRAGLAGVLILVVAACSAAGTPGAPPTPGATPVATPTAASTLAPTPAATPTPAPTQEPQATATPVASPAATATITPATPVPSSATETPIELKIPTVNCTIDNASGEKLQANPGALTAKLPKGMAFAVTYYWSGWGAAFLAPAAWKCTGLIGGDNTSVYSIIDPADSTAVVTYASAARSYGSMLLMACPLFPQAATLLKTDLSTDCELPPAVETPAAETTTAISSTIVRFNDPAGIKGTGVGSGGSLAVTGAVFWDGNTAQKVSCALPDDQAAVCNAVISTFVDALGGG